VFLAGEFVMIILQEKVMQTHQYQNMSPLLVILNIFFPGKKYQLR